MERPFGFRSSTDDAIVDGGSMQRVLHGFAALLIGCVGLPPSPPGDEAASSTGPSGVTTTSTMPPPGSSSEGSTSLGASGTDAADSTDGAGGWRHEISVSGHPQGPVDAVPVRIHLEFAVLQLPVQPQDLSFVDNDGLTPLPFEIESWGEAAAEIWVLVPEVTGEDRSIWMDYARAVSPMLRPPTEVWGNALGVWHLQAGVLDSSSQSNDGVMGASPGEGMIAGGHTYDGFSVDDLPPVGSSAAGSVQLWFRARPEQPGNRLSGLTILFHGSADFDADGFGSAEELYVAVDLNEPNHQLEARAFRGADSSLNLRQTGAWLDDQWHHVTVTWEEGGAEERGTLYVDGVEQDADGTLPSPFDFSALVRLGGVEFNPARSFAGELDEVRFREVAIEPDRVGIEYAAQLQDFVSIGPALPID